MKTNKRARLNEGSIEIERKNESLEKLRIILRKKSEKS